MTVTDKVLAAQADAAHAGARLDLFLAGYLPGLSRTRLQSLIRQGHVKSKDRAGTSGETIRDPGYRVKPGEAFELQLPPPEPAGLAPQAISLSIVYEDDQLLVIDKPAGLVVHPGAGNPDNTLVNALLAHCGTSLSGIGGVARPGIVHRLDKDTSGLLVVAKTDAAHRSLAAQFADHGRSGDLERRYLALVWGALPRPSGTVNAAIGRHPTARTKMAVLKPGHSGARQAVTQYRVLETFRSRDDPKAQTVASLVECTLETGRTHQVRLHMAHLGNPLIGDPVYAQGFKSKLRTLSNGVAAKIAVLHRQALHAAYLAFRHPVTGKLLEFESPLPPDLDNLTTSLKEL